jgi:membrane fusion protein (multidrug efflux system)
VHLFFVSGARGAMMVLGLACARGDATPPPQGDAQPAKAAKTTQGPDAKTPPAGDSKPQSGSGDAKSAGGREGGGARTASVVLGATDVYRVARGTVEVGVPISGDLRPLETATVRARVDGILETVNVREGQAVAAGAVLAKFESTEQESGLRSAEADRVAAKSDYETARWNADQSKELFKVGAIAERDMRTADQAADAAQARLAATEARLRSAANVVRDTKVVAPFAGVIEHRKVQGGENTPRGTEMFTLVRSAVLELTAAVPARRADEVKVGQAVRFMADGRQFTGRVARISPTIDPASRSMTVYIQVPNARGELKGNSSATGQIIAKALTGVLVVPEAAIRSSPDAGKPFVYRIAGGELAIATVQLGIRDDARGTVQVIDGLTEQDDIVVGNPGTLGRGMKVQVIGNEGRGSGGRGKKSAP